MKRTGIFLILLTAFIFKIYATEIYNKEADYIAYIPEDWTLHNGENPLDFTFVSEDQSMGMRIYCYDKDQFETPAQILEKGTSDLSGKASTAPFTYSGSEAIIADVDFKDGDGHFRGWFLALNGAKHDYLVLTFTAQNLYQTNLPTLLSTIDSISFGLENRYMPGVISQMYYPYSGNPEKRREIMIPFAGNKVSLLIDQSTEEASQIVIEREAKVLSTLAVKGEELFYLGWIRYYRLVYRDNKVRLKEFSENIHPFLKGKSDSEKAKMLLVWVQSFRYTRTQDTISDFRAPTTAIHNMEGDCDVRAIIYTILLNYEGIDAVFLVSNKYKHALSAVDIPGKGIRYTFNKKGYLMAETTVKDLSLGFIDQEHKDPSKWVPIFFKGDKARSGASK